MQAKALTVWLASSQHVSKMPYVYSAHVSGNCYRNKQLSVTTPEDITVKVNVFNELWRRLNGTKNGCTMI
jgi:hypothetical protein